MSFVVLDDHLLRDLLADESTIEIRRLLRRRTPATTNLYYLRLCKSVVSARGGQLTRLFSDDQRRALGRALVTLPDHIQVLPMRDLAYRMAEIAQDHLLSALGAEAVSAAEHLDAPLCVWGGDDGPHIRAAAAAMGVGYRTIER